MRRILKLIVKIAASLVSAILISALGLVGFVYQQARRPSSATPQYVALGSSYGSGPGLQPRAPESPVFCAQSQNNYAHQLARRLKLSLVDRTCAGATSEHVLHGGQLFQTAQLDAVDRRTRLVTMTIGGNDVFYLSNLVAESCDQRTPFVWRALGACRAKSAAAVDQGFVKLEANFAQVIAVLHARAPLARVVVVNYLTVLPEQGACSRLGLTVPQADAMRAVAARLQDATRRIATGGVTLLDAAILSKRHDVCAADPWIAGAHPDGPHIAPLHPNLEGMTAVTDALQAMSPPLSALPNGGD